MSGHSSTEAQISENKFKLLVKEKKNYEVLIDKIVNSLPSEDMKKIIRKILEDNTEITNNENQRIELEESLNK